MNPLEEYYEHLAATVGKNLVKRNMGFSYCTTGKEAVETALSLLNHGDTVSFGGSMTLEETGMLSALREANTLTLLDRSTGKTPEEINDIYRQSFSANAFLMSTNALTLEGELVNVDGIGNRVAALSYGPDKVIILAGINKISTTLEDAIHRVHNVAAPPNGNRLKRNTPCAATGVCSDCLSPECMCSQTLITRRSGKPGRIHVILIGQSYGY